MIALRPYQERSVDAARTAYADGAQGVALVLPTGAGKTVIAAHIARAALARGGRVVVMCHRAELMTQARFKLATAGIEPGAVRVESVQTMVRRLDALPSASLLILDECHHMGADLWAELPRAYAAARRLGLTATPQRGDGRCLVGFDSLVAPVSVRELTELGHLVPCDVVAAPPGSEMADPVAALEEHGKGRPAVVFAASVDHAEALARAIPSAAHVDGEMPAEMRAERLAAFADGALQTLVNVHVLTEGWDCPRAAVAVVARGCSAASTWLQMVGRVLRPHPGKARALVIDCRGAVYQHGLPGDERRWSLEGDAHSMPERLPALRQCPQCGGVARSAPECPACGWAFPPPEPPRAKRLEMRRVDTVAPESERRAYYRAMLARCAARGHNPGAAAHLFRARYGHWPQRGWAQKHE